MVAEHSKACCTLPVAQAGLYSPQGTYEQIGGLKTYITGSHNATKCILFIPDIFGFHSNSLQGADVLANNTHLVAMPDIYDNQPANPAWFPADTEEKKALVGKFLAEVASVPRVVPIVHSAVEALRKEYSSIEDISVIGYCFGGKVVAVMSGEGTPFKCAVQTSPARVDPADAEKTVIPMCMLASKGEDAEVVRRYGEALRVPKRIEIFAENVHGFMSARATLENEDERKAYTRGYEMALDFFGQYA